MDTQVIAGWELWRRFYSFQHWN